jgi:hypothetical protein
LVEKLAQDKLGIQDIVFTDNDSGLVQDSPILPDRGKELVSDAMGVRGPGPRKSQASALRL